MASGFGVSDVLALTKFIVTTIEDIHNAPTELQELADRVMLVESNLQSINKLPSKAAAGNTEKIKRLVKRIDKVLSKIRDVVIKYKNTDGWKKAIFTAKYGIWDKGEIDDLVDKLEQGTRDLTDSLVIQNLLMTDQLRSQIDQIFRSVCQEQQLMKNQSPAQDTNAAFRPKSSKQSNDPSLNSNQIDLVQSVLECVLHSKQPSNVALPPNEEDVSIEREIEVRLGQAGIEAKFTEALISIINNK